MYKNNVFFKFKYVSLNLSVFIIWLLFFFNGALILQLSNKSQLVDTAQSIKLPGPSIILINSYKEHPKVPAIEQKLSTATAAQNIMLALNAMEYSCIWRTGKMAFNKVIQKELGLEKNQEILGYLYIGTEVGKKKEIPNLDIDNFVSYL